MSESEKHPVDKLSDRIDCLSDSHRIKHNVVDIKENEQERGADVVLTLERFGRADLHDMHSIATDWEVAPADPDNPEHVRLMVWIDGEVPMGGESE